MQQQSPQKKQKRKCRGRPNNTGKFLIILYALLNKSKEKQMGVKVRRDRQGFTITNEKIFKKAGLAEFYQHSRMGTFLKNLDNYWFQERKDFEPLDSSNRSFTALHFDIDRPKYRVKGRARVKKDELKNIKWPVQIIMNNKEKDKNYDPNVKQEKSDDQDEEQDEDYDVEYEEINGKDTPQPSGVEDNLQYPSDLYLMSQRPLEEPQKQFDDDLETKKMLETLGQLQADQQMLGAQVQFLKDSNTNVRIDLDQFLESDKTSTFKMHYIQYMQQYVLEELGMLMDRVNSSAFKRQPYLSYFYAYRRLNPQTSKIAYRSVTKEVREIYWDSKFDNKALELEHSGNKVDFDTFFKFDWKEFEIMRFNNCQIENEDWTKFCNHAKHNLPNLKHIYLKSNMIKFVREKDFEQFPSLKMIDFTDNRINGLCEKEIKSYVLKKNNSVIIERD